MQRTENQYINIAIWKDETPRSKISTNDLLEPDPGNYPLLN